MFYRITIGISLVLYSAILFPCAVTIRDEKHDQLIDISVNSDDKAEYNQEHYIIKFPEKIDIGEFSEVNLLIYDKTIDDSYIAVPLKAKMSNGMYKLELEFYKELDVALDLVVIWGSRGCPVSGHVTLKHNKSLKHGTPPVGGAP